MGINLKFSSFTSLLQEQDATITQRLPRISKTN
jgi:hypothetical protein